MTGASMPRAMCSHPGSPAGRGSLEFRHVEGLAGDPCRTPFVSSRSFAFPVSFPRTRMVRLHENRTGSEGE